MTTKEFIKAVEELGYEAVDYGDFIEIEYIGERMAIIFQSDVFKVDTVWLNNNWNKNAGTLFALIFQYASTPVKDREEEKKFYIKHKWIGDETLSYLQFDREHNCHMLNLAIGDNSWKKEFTEEEIEGFKQTFNTNLEDFEIIEVKDEN